MDQVKLDGTIQGFLMDYPLVAGHGYVVEGSYNQSYGVDVINPDGSGMHFTVYGESDPEGKVREYLTSIFQHKQVI